MKLSYLSLSLSLALSGAAFSSLILPMMSHADSNTTFSESSNVNPLREADVEYQALRNRWAESFLGDPAIAFDEKLQKMVSSTNNAAQVNWSSMSDSAERSLLWNDLSLNAQTDAGKKVLGANIRASYQRLFTMAKAYRLRGGALENDPQLLAAVIDGMAFLNRNYYKVGAKEWGNWWHWELGTPKDIHNILVILYEKLPLELITSHTQATRYFTPKATHLGAGEGADVSSNPQYRVSTGGNRTDNTLVVILRGVLDNNSAEIEAAMNALPQILEYIDQGDGFYADGSFLQHSDIAYNGTYGNVLLNGLGLQINLVAGSRWAATDPALQEIYPIIFKSYAPLLYRGTMMDFVNGRAISRPKEQGHHVGHMVIASLLHYVDGADEVTKVQLKTLIKNQIQQDSFINFFDSINHVGNYQKAATIVNNDVMQRDDDDEDADSQEGFFHFPAMDRVVFRDDDWVFSLAMHSSRLGNFECMNNENRTGWFTGDGMGYLYNGQLDSYHDFWPVVNPYRLEGTTVDDQLMLECDGQRNQIKGGRKTQMDWVGAVKLNDMGAAGMDFSNWNDTLTAKKSWFMFDEEVVMLGSNIQSSLNANVTTTVANRKLPDDLSTKIFINGKSWQPKVSESLELKSLTLRHRTIDDADLSYVFLKPTKVTLGQDQQTGDWRDIGTSSGLVSATFLTATIEQSDDNDQYAYVLLPDADRDDVAEFIDEMPIKVLRNDQLAHIVKHRDEEVIAANVWTNEPIALNHYVTAESKMAIMIAKEKQHDVIAISDPLQNQIKLALKFKKPVQIIEDKQNRLEQDKQGNMTVNVEGLKGESYLFMIK